MATDPVAVNATPPASATDIIIPKASLNRGRWAAGAADPLMTPLMP
jgi:hypothetical protein